MAKISKAELIRLQKKLKTDARIGEEFGITRQAIHQLRKKYGIDSRIAGNKERNSEIVKLREAGKSVESLAKKYDLSIPQTYKIINEATAGTKKAAKKKTAKKAPAVSKKVSKKVDVKNPAPAKVVKKKVVKKKK
jgi:uncharacterized protein (DUF433 family)